MSDLLKSNINNLVEEINKERELSNLNFDNYKTAFSVEKSSFDIMLSHLGFDFDIQDSLRSLNKNMNALNNIVGLYSFFESVITEIKDAYENQPKPPLYAKILTFAANINSATDAILNETDDMTDVNILDTGAVIAQNFINIMYELSNENNNIVKNNLSDLTQKYLKKIPIIGGAITVFDFYVEAKDLTVPIFNSSVADQSINTLNKYINDFNYAIEAKTNGNINKNEVMLKNYFSYFKNKYGDVLGNEIGEIEKKIPQNKTLNEIIFRFNELTKSLNEYKNFLVAFDGHPDYIYKKTEKEKVLQTLSAEIENEIGYIYNDIEKVDLSEFEDTTTGDSFQDWLNSKGSEIEISTLLTKMKNVEINSTISEYISSYSIENDFLNKFVVSNDMNEYLETCSKNLSLSYSNIFKDFFENCIDDGIFNLTIDEINDLIIPENEGLLEGIGGTLHLNDWLDAIDKKIIDDTKDALDFIKNENKTLTDDLLNQMLKDILLEETTYIKEEKFYTLDDLNNLPNSESLEYLQNIANIFNDKMNLLREQTTHESLEIIINDFVENKGSLIENPSILRDHINNTVSDSEIYIIENEFFNNIDNIVENNVSFINNEVDLDKISIDNFLLETKSQKEKDYINELVLDIRRILSTDNIVKVLNDKHSEEALELFDIINYTITEQNDIKNAFNTLNETTDLVRDLLDQKTEVTQKMNNFQRIEYIMHRMHDYLNYENDLGLLIDNMIKDLIDIKNLEIENYIETVQGIEYKTLNGLRIDDNNNDTIEITDAILILVENNNEVEYKNIITDISLLTETDFENLYFWKDKDGDGNYHDFNNVDLGELLNLSDFNISNLEELKNNFNNNKLRKVDDSIFRGDNTEEEIYEKAEPNIDAGAGNDFIFGKNSEDYILGKDGNDVIHSNDGQDIVYGGDGDDELYGGNGTDILNGGDGNDIIGKHYGSDYYGSEHTALTEDIGDIIHGGKGNDTIYDTYHSDVITFNLGDGNDTIYLSNALENNGKSKDVIRFGEGISKNDIQFERIESNSVNFDLKIIINENDSILLKDWFKNNTSAYKIESFEFSNGETLSWLDIHNEFGLNKENPNGSTINGNHNYDDILIGTDGHDYIYGLSGNNELHGGDGNDYLKGHYTNGYQGGSYIWADKTDRYLNKYYGGKGNDTIEASVYTEEIYYNLGDGHDTLNMNYRSETESSNSKGKDVLVLGDGITINELSFEKLNEDLIIRISEGTENEGSITIKQYFYQAFQSSYKIEEIQFNDGSVMSWENIVNLIFEDTGYIGTDNNDYIRGFENADNNIDGANGDDQIYGGNLNDNILGSDGNDQLHGGYGNDTLNGGAGNDTLGQSYSSDRALSNDFDQGNTLIGGDGNDKVYDTDGDDVIIYNLGDGHDTLNLSYRSDFDILKFGENIQESDLIFEVNNKNLVIKIATGTENEGSITIENWFGDLNNSFSKIEEVLFSDGTKLNWKIITQTALDNGYTNHQGSELSEHIYGFENINNNIYGNDGDDTIYGKNLDDYIDGGNGNDILNGGYGKDTLIGGNGNDLLGNKNQDEDYQGNDGRNENGEFIGYEATDSGNIYEGGEGDDVIYDTYHSDIFIYNVGDGSDTYNLTNITENETDTGSKRRDVLRFGEGISLSNLTFSVSGFNLIITAFEGLDNEGRLTFSNWFKNLNNSSFKAEVIEFYDGTILSWNDVNNYIDPSDLENLTGNQILNGTNENDNLIGGDGEDTINGLDGDDNITGGFGRDILNGGEGNDTLGESWGEDYNGSPDFDENGEWLNPNLKDNGNVFNGGKGNDIIYDTMHSDTIIYNLGDGHDTIYLSHDTENTSGNGESLKRDILEFGENISLSDLSFEQVNSNLIITIAAGSEHEGSIHLSNWFNSIDSSSNKIEEFKFNDGSVYSWLEIMNIANPNIYYGDDNDNVMNGTENNDYLFGLDGQDVIDGGLGDDIIDGGFGKDTLIGGEGNDTLGGTYNNDYQGNNPTLENGEYADILLTDSGNILIGGKGDDTIHDTIHSDTIIYNLGDGHDSLTMAWDAENLSNDGKSLRKDVLEFGENISLSDLLFVKSNSDLIIKVVTGTENEGSLHIWNWFNQLNDSSQKIEEIKLIDGTVLSWQEVSAMADDSIIIDFDKDGIINGDEFNNTVIDSKNNDTINSKEGDDIVYIGAGDDFVNTDTGNDKVILQEGNNTVYTGDGNDIVEVWYNAGNNIIKLGDGDDITNLNNKNNTVYLGNGNDTVNISGGNDVIYSESGDNHFIFNVWENSNTIINMEEHSLSDNNIIRFGYGVSKEHLTFSKDGEKLIINVENQYNPDQVNVITINNWFTAGINGGHHKIEQILFDEYHHDTLDVDYIEQNASVQISYENSEEQFGLLSQEMASFGADDEDIDSSGNINTSDPYIYN